MKRIKLLLIIMILLSQLNCMKHNKFEKNKIIKVKVLNNEFKVVKIIDEEIYLTNFCNYLNNIESSSLPQNINWDFKIDIESKNKYDNGRWLYDKKGYIAKLNYQLKPCYKLSNIEDFNNLIIKD